MKNSLFREILGDEGRLIEIMNEDDQELVVNVTRSAEEYFEDPQKSYWWTGLEAPGEDEDHIWTWITSELYLSKVTLTKSYSRRACSKCYCKLHLLAWTRCTG